MKSLDYSTVKCDGTPSEVLARLRAVALDWRDSARPAAFSGLTIEPVSYTAVGDEGFRIDAPISGSRFFGAVAIGTVTVSDGQTVIRYRTALDPTVGRAVVQVTVLLTCFALFLALLRRSLSNFFWLPLLGTPFILIPSLVTANSAIDGHCQALRTLVLRAAKNPRATP